MHLTKSFAACLLVTLGSAGCGRSPGAPSPLEGALLPAVTISSIAPGFGPSFSQTTVRITGRGFETGAKVSFGGHPATPLSRGSTWLEVLTPSNLDGVVDVVVTNPDGEEARLARGFAFNSLAALSVSPAAAMPTDWVTIAGAGFLPGARVTMAGADVTVRSVTHFAIGVVVPLCEPGTVEVVVTNPDGRSSTLAQPFTCQTVLLTPSSRAVTPGSLFSLSWSSPREMDDWVEDEIHLCLVGDSCASPAWETVVIHGNGNAPVRAPLASGDYEFRYLMDGRLLLSKSAPVSVR